jgi:hypothetical protein
LPGASTVISVSRSAYDAHRPLRADENLDTILTWRVERKVSDALTLLNDRVIWLLDDTPATRRLIGRYIDVWEYPDGRLEIRADGGVLPLCRMTSSRRLTKAR